MSVVEEGLLGYRVLGTLGVGAASTIYRVQDPRDGQLYALKQVLKKDKDDQRFIDQAVNEHSVASQIDHPLLRKTYHLLRRRSVLRTIEVLLVMELVEGHTLYEARPKSMRNMVRLFRAVARGLSHMHHAGLVHADMKPINILISDGGAVKIIDFGQSCSIGTIKERIQGTMDYIAPEQVKLHPIFPHTDVYNLGATMYWCVTNRFAPTVMRRKAPRGGRSISGSSRHVTDPREYNPKVPGALASLIIDCLRRDPLRRPDSMDQVRARLGMAIYQLDRTAKPDEPDEPQAGLDAQEAEASHDAGDRFESPPASGAVDESSAREEEAEVDDPSEEKGDRAPPSPPQASGPAQSQDPAI